MTSRTSCFDRSLCGHLLRRFWPLWLGYFALLLPSFCFRIPQFIEELTRRAYPPDIQSWLLQCAVDQVQLAPVVAIAAVMILFSWLYSSRECGMMHALPLRRETLFVTAWLTGLTPLLLCQVLAMLLGWLLGLGHGIRFVWLLQWLGLSALALTAFYGFAVFCAFLTGSLWVLPAVYVMLGCGVAVAEASLNTVFGQLRYGGGGAAPDLMALSPLLYTYSKIMVLYSRGSGLELRGLRMLGVYAAAGLVLSGCALLLYRRRQLECAGDAVAVPVLKPVFRLCMCFGTALVFTALLLEAFILPDSPAALTALTLLLLLLGAALGFLLAEALMQRSFRPALRAWKGPAAICLLFVLLTAAVRLDLSGQQRWCPEPERVEYVQVNDVTLRDPESIRLTVALHRSVLAARARLEGTRDGYTVVLSYRLTGGELRTRYYTLPCDTERPDEILLEAAALLDCPEAVESRVALDLPVTPETVSHAQIEVQEGEGYYQALPLTAEQAAALYREGILPDAAEGHMGRCDLLNRAPAERLYFHLILESETPSDPNAAMSEDTYRSFAIAPDAAHSLAWMRENLGFTPDA